MSEKKSREHQHIKSIELSAKETEALKDGFRNMKKILGNKSIEIEDIVSLVTSADIKNAAQKVSIRVSEDSVSQMNMVAFD